MRALFVAVALCVAVPAAAEDESVLPAGDGRDTTYALCTACHDTAVIRRSRLGRAQWDALMDWMVEKHGMVPLDPDSRTEVVNYLAGSFGPAAGARRRSPFLP